MIEDLYKLRTALEEGIRLMLSDIQITAITRANSPANFQQVTPRVEIKCSIGQATGHRFLCPDGITRFDRWRVNIGIQCITRPAADGVNAINEVFVSNIRNFCSTLAQVTWTDFNHFPNVRLAEPLKESGGNDTLKAAEACEYSTLGFTGVLCIRETAWTN